MLDSPVNIAVAEQERAQRFELQITLRYRAEGDSQWRKGVTRNISHSGVLFHGEDGIEPNTPLEVSLTLPREIAGKWAAEVIFRGRVTRSERVGGDGGGALIATRILHYRFVRP